MNSALSVPAFLSFLLLVTSSGAHVMWNHTLSSGLEEVFGRAVKCFQWPDSIERRTYSHGCNSGVEVVEQVCEVASSYEADAILSLFSLTVHKLHPMRRWEAFFRTVQKGVIQSRSDDETKLPTLHIISDADVFDDSWSFLHAAREHLEDIATGWHEVPCDGHQGGFMKDTRDMDTQDLRDQRIIVNNLMLLTRCHETFVLGSYGNHASVKNWMWRKFRHDLNLQDGPLMVFPSSHETFIHVFSHIRP